jgi:hypothetical protein
MPAMFPPDYHGGRHDGSVSERSDHIQQSVKEWLESGEDGIPDELRNLLQNSVNAKGFQVFSRRILERYKNGSLTLHFHIEESVGDAGVIGMIQRNPGIPEYCAVAQFLTPEEHGHESVLASAPINSGITSDSGNKTEHLVLIEFVEIGHSPERIVPTRVRLQTLDECRSFVGQPIQPMPSYLVNEGLGRGADREHVPNRVLTCRSGINKLPDKVIERSPSVEEKISDHGTKTIRRLGQSHSHESNISLRIMLGNDLAIAVGTARQNLRYSFSMLICPDQFSFG